MASFKEPKYLRLPEDNIYKNYWKYLSSRFSDNNSINIDKIIIGCLKFIKIYLPECPMLPLNYLDKYFKNTLIEEPYIFLITLILITVKWIEDSYPSNKAISKIFNISILKLNYYERTILEKIDYRLYVSEEDYDAFIKEHC